MESAEPAAEEEMTDALFYALAAEPRRVLLAELREATLNGQALTISQLANRASIPRPAASRHLKILRQCGLATEDRHGTRAYQRLHIRALRPVEEWVLGFTELDPDT
jgi:DNA-binding transcriptional ArsR family regulator